MGNPVGRLDKYERDHLVVHLGGAGCGDQVHRLLGLETSSGLNAWFEARDAADELGGFVADIERAEAITQENPNGLGLRCRYSLMLSSIRSRASGLPSPLVVTLLRAGLWSQERARAYVRQIQDAVERAQLGADLLPLVEQPRTWFRELLGVAQSIDQAEARGKALARLLETYPAPADADLLRSVLEELPHLDAKSRWQVLEAAASVTDGGALAEIVSMARRLDVPPAVVLRIAYRLPGAERDPIVVELLEKAVASNDLVVRDAIVVALGRERGRHASRVETLRQEVVKEALGSVTSDEYSGFLARSVLQDQLPFAPESEQELILDSLLEQFASQPRSLPALARALPPRLCNRVLSRASQIPDEVTRTDTLAKLVQHLQEPGRSATVAEVLRVVLKRPGQLGAWLADNTERLAAYLTDQQASDIAAKARAMKPHFFSAKALVDLALQGVPKRGSSIADAIAQIRAISDSKYRRELVGRLAPCLDAARLREVELLVTALDDGSELAGGLPLLIPFLDETGRARSWAFGLAVTREIYRTGARLRFAESAISTLLPDMRGHALDDIAGEVPHFRATVLLSLAAALPSAEREPMLEQAEALEAQLADDDNDRLVLAVRRVAYESPERRRLKLASVIRRVLERPSLEDQAPLLASLAPLLSPAQRDHLLRDALQAPQPYSRGRGVLLTLAPHLSQTLCRQLVLDLNRGYLDPLRWWREYRPLVKGQLRLGFAIDDSEENAVFLRLCLNLALASEGAWAYEMTLARGGDAEAWTLARLAAVLPPVMSREALDQVLNLLPIDSPHVDLWPGDPFGPASGGTSFSGDQARDYILVLVTRRLAELGSTDEAFQYARTIQVAERRCQALEGIAPYLDEAHSGAARMEALEAALLVEPAFKRPERLSVLGELFAKRQRVDASRAAARILTWQAWRPRAEAVATLCAVGPLLIAAGSAVTPIEMLDAIEATTRWWP